MLFIDRCTLGLEVEPMPRLSTLIPELVLAVDPPVDPLPAVISDIVRTMDESGLTRSEVARRMGITPGRVSNLFKQTDHKLSTLVKLARAVGCELRLTLDTGEPERSEGGVESDKVPDDSAQAPLAWAVVRWRDWAQSRNRRPGGLCGRVRMRGDDEPGIAR